MANDVRSDGNAFGATLKGGGQAVFTSGFEVYFVVPGPHLRAAARGRAWAAVAIHRDDGVARELPK